MIAYHESQAADLAELEARWAQSQLIFEVLCKRQECREVVAELVCAIDHEGHRDSIVLLVSSPMASANAGVAFDGRSQDVHRQGMQPRHITSARKHAAAFVWLAVLLSAPSVERLPFMAVQLKCGRGHLPAPLTLQEILDHRGQGKPMRR